MIEEKIGLFELYNKEPNNIKYGYLYQCLFETYLPIEKNRMVRVFLPDDYFTNKDKRYGVMYMSDGQNLVDKYLSAFGEWNIDEHNHEMMKNGYEGLIYVGFDCPKCVSARCAEMIPEDLFCSGELYLLENAKKYPHCGSKYLDYIFKEIKPIIDQTFRTLPDRDHTLFGGSSMGGLISFYAGFYCQNFVSKILCYSPAFVLSKQTVFIKFLRQLVKRYGSNIKIAFLNGGRGLEKLLMKHTTLAYLELLKLDFDEKQLDMVIDSSEDHNEAFWSKYFIHSMEFLLKYD